MKRPILHLTEIAMMAALALVLDLISIKGFWGYGGSVSLAMVPILLMAYRRGLSAGLITGFIVGSIQMFTGYFVHPVQIFLDYALAYTVVGFAGVFTITPLASRTKRALAIIIGVFLASFLRFITHFISGVVWFGIYAPEGMNVILYSIIYNASYMIPVFLLSTVIFILLSNTAPRLLHGK
ncbi:energy-coupled thiamine transporter ThiT [Anaerobacillus isosaccharinicus]|uniref:Energy-coupled thiamine transporter ThiT n=1 Tax=Anaerobacillus isosaccharinicus TaxID=1532552 RepID=A0A1S2L744_9BACI|nr:energy-coupled thiamine transporter ThiT [Anaerobacillus isosaccharinicus]MBA5587386.1 energy-coupled thiamine transporter ThiT [Anaerobacillus isosaccharinicus]QOY34422.1 energy-coupled thiamine transporter ThiT [Anaerobacillus isosaccharinicus]